MGEISGDIKENLDHIAKWDGAEWKALEKGVGGMGEMKLKACPFCGGRAKIDVRKTNLGKYITSVYCDMCLARTEQELIGEFGLDKFVKRTWNTRPIEAALQARAEKAEAMVERFVAATKLSPNWSTRVAALTSLVDEWNQSKKAEAE